MKISEFLAIGVAAAGLSLSISDSALANKNKQQAVYDTLTRSDLALKSANRSSARKKSKRQKCLDMVLIQDGVDCIKKLEAKKK